MIYIFNKNKIISYVLACSFVLMLFIFNINSVPNDDVKLIKVSTNAMENANNILNNYLNNENNLIK